MTRPTHGLPFVLLFVLLLGLVGAAVAQAPNVKLGTWNMAYSGTGMPRPISTQSCVTREDLAELAGGPDLDPDQDDGCKTTKPVRNGNRWSVERTCPGGRADRVEFTVESPERLKGTITVAGPRPMAVQMTGQWVRAGCAGVK